MPRSLLVALAVLCAGAAALARPSGSGPGNAAVAAVARPPDIVVVMTDDHPALDGRLERLMPTARSLFVDEGLRFSDFHSETPLCCPARAGYLTGQHSHNHGVIRNDARLLDPSETIATELHAVGYHTILAGKYLNGYGSCTSRNPNCAPNVPAGWDDFHALASGGYYAYPLWDNGVPTHYGSAPADYSTDVIADRAVTAIRTAPPDRLRDPSAVADRDAILDEQLAPQSPRIGDPRWHAVTTTGRSSLARRGCAGAAAGSCRWHYVEYETGEMELYDVSNGPCWGWAPGSEGDPCELANLAGRRGYGAIRRALAERLAALSIERG